MNTGDCVWEKQLNRNSLVQRWFPLPSEHVLVDCKVCAKTSEYCSSGSKMKLRTFLASCPFESSRAELESSTTWHLVVVDGSRSHATCRSPKYRKAMHLVEGIKHKNGVFHQLNLLVRRSFCADLYNCANAPILSGVILFLKYVGAEVFQHCVLMPSLSETQQKMRKTVWPFLQW